jgi:hypothetical protein
MNPTIRLMALACLAATSAGDKPAAEGPPPAAGVAADAAPAASASAVARILAMPTMVRCGADIPDVPAPTETRVLDLGGGAFAVLADCTLEAASPTKALFVQGADGVLKRQPLLVYNGPGYPDEYQFEAVPTLPLVWNEADKVLTGAFDLGPQEEGSPVTTVSTLRWRWDGSRMALIDAAVARPAAPGGAAAGPVKGYPKTPAGADPTPPAKPV